MARLPRIADLDVHANGAGFFLCARKERRPGRSGVFLSLVLQDVSGEIAAKVFQDVDLHDQQFTPANSWPCRGAATCTTSGSSWCSRRSVA